MISIEETKAITRRVGKAALDVAFSITAPMFWVVRNPDGTVGTRNGTAFFMRTEKALFGVTAAHVIEGPKGWREHCQTDGKTPLRLGALDGPTVSFDWDARAVDINVEIDIATFVISPHEIEVINRAVYSGNQTEWPPAAAFPVLARGTRPSVCALVRYVERAS